MPSAWHTLQPADVLRELAAPEGGLTPEEALRRLQLHGPNELQVPERSSAWHTLAAQFRNVLVVILLAATLLSGLLGHGLEATVIAVIVLFAVLLGLIPLSTTMDITSGAAWRSAIGAFFLGLVLRPTESPTRLGWCIFAIAGLFLLNMARAISADQRCEQMRYSLKHEAERLRAKLPPPAKLAP